jgi:thiamine monophosphate kinase
MKEPQAAESGEDRLIARYFKPLATHPGAFGLLDDAAAIAPPPGCDLVLKTDGVVAGMHFFPDDPPDTVARKALRVNLSDLAAKGASPLGFLLTLVLPPEIGDDWLAPFARGLTSRARCSAVIPTARPGRSPYRLRCSAPCRTARWCVAPVPASATAWW